MVIRFLKTRSLRRIPSPGLQKGIMCTRLWTLAWLVFIHLFCMIQLCQGAAPGSWDYFKRQFINSDGRVIDYKQQEISHSEGQGYGMLLAVKADDRKIFERLWNWTKDNLQVRSTDALICWSWGKRVTGEWTILDYNNATDGDIFIAYSLLSAFEKWRIEEYKKEAHQILDSMVSRLIIQQYGKTLLLPGYHGFNHGTKLILNPSYLVFPAFSSFVRHHKQDLWLKVYDDGLSMVANHTFSELNLPPDWLLLSGDGGTVFSKRSDLFGFEAIRVFLFLALEKKLNKSSGAPKLLDRIGQIRFVPMSFDLTRNTMSIWPGPAGFYAVMALVAETLERTETASWLWKEAKSRLQSEPLNYYSHALYLLASQETGL